MIIGIAGGRGCGKTMVYNILKSSHKARTIMMDNLEKSIIKPGRKCYEELIDAFGSEILVDVSKDALYGVSDKEIKPVIDKKRLYKKAASVPDGKKILETILNPEIDAEIDDSVSIMYEMDENALILIECEDLIEKGYDKYCDEIWVVTADKQTRIDRWMNTGRFSKERCEEILADLSAEEKYAKMADFIIDNSKDVENSANQIKERIKQYS